MPIIEYIGIAASVFIVISVVFNSTTLKGNLIFRAFNTAGSIAFVVYGIVLKAIATAICNGAMICVNVYYIIKLIIEYKKKKLEDK